jgi:hypothetical protein
MNLKTIIGKMKKKEKSKKRKKKKEMTHINSDLKRREIMKCKLLLTEKNLNHKEKYVIKKYLKSLEK